MDIKSLQIIISISDTGSFVAAAEQVNLSPSAISLRMKVLEDQICIPLFDRSHRSPTLNSEGRAFVERARHIVDSWQNLVDDFTPVRHNRTLNLGVVPTSLLSAVPLAMRSLRVAIPNLHINLTTGLSDQLSGMVARGELDCAVVSEAMTLPDELVFRIFISEPLVVIAPHDLAGETDIELLSNSPYIRFKKHTWAGTRIDNQIISRKIKLDITMEVDTLDGICHLVSNGIGVSVVPQRHKNNPFPNGIRVIPFGDPQVYRNVGLLEHQNNANRDTTGALYQALLEVCRSEKKPGGFN